MAVAFPRETTPAPRPEGAWTGLAPVDLRAERAVRRTGVDASTVERLPFDLSALDEDGVFVNVDARGFGLLDRRLDWQALGISLPRGSDLAFRPPRCGLLPDRFRLPLLRPAARAHAALNRYSFHFTLTETLFESPAYRYVPWNAFEAFEQAFQQAQSDLEEALTEYEGSAPLVREEVLAAFAQLAEDSARRLEATGQSVPPAFREAVVQGVRAAVPSPETLCERLSLRYRVGVLLLGSEMLAEQRRAREERLRLDQSEAELRLEHQRQETSRRIVQERLWAEQERLRQQQRAEAEERQREADVKERLRRLKIEAARERLQEAMSPLEEGARQLHAAVYEAASTIRTSLQKHHHLPGASAKKARDLARWFSLMNWQSDQQLETLLAELDALARRPAGRKARPNPAALDQVLGDIVDLCYADARALAQGPSRMQALEL